MSSAEEQRDTVIALLHAFGAADSALGRQFARQQQMHPTDAAAIVEILDAEQRSEFITPARLGERIGLTAGATSTLVNRLEGAGHVVRTRGHADRRLVGLHTTPQVHVDADAFFAPIGSALAAALAEYTPEEIDSFESILRRLTAVVDAELSGREA